MRNFVDDQLRRNVGLRQQHQPGITYDFIYADAFNDFSIPCHLTTLEFLQKTHDLLSDDGVFQANIIDIYPRTEYPGQRVGVAEVEYRGRLPSGVLPGEPKREKPLPAATAFAPLEIMELLTNHYRLSTKRILMPSEIGRLMSVNWPIVTSNRDYDVTKGVAPDIDTQLERENWRTSIESLASAARKKVPYRGTIPAELQLTEGPLKEWTSAPAPFEFVESFRLDETTSVLGFRGRLSPESVERLIRLDPQNTAWLEAVSAAAAKSGENLGGAFMGRYIATAAKVFPNVYVFSTSKGQPDGGRDTFVMVCSRRPLDLTAIAKTGDWSTGPFASLETKPESGEPALSGQMSSVLALADGKILTDDFAPVDNLLAPVFSGQE